MPSCLCEFVFQHRYGKKWICYSDRETEVLNKALRRNQKTVTLPSKDVKKQIVVNFESMLQKNMVSNTEQRVRSLIFTKEYHAWMFKDDDDEYSSFRPFQVYFLETAFQQNLQEIKFYNYGDYTVDLKKLRLVEEESNYTTPVVRESVKLESTTGINAITYKSEALSEEMRLNESLRSLCKESRIFDSSLGASVKSSKIRLSSDLFPNSNEFVEDMPDFFNFSVDKECPDAEDYTVYSAGKIFYSAVLAFTSLENNINKYLIIQVLANSNKYFLWQRWGRIGFKAQTDLKKFGSKLNAAVNEFEDKFYDKTKNEWQDVLNFKKCPGKYDILRTDLSPEVIETRVDVESRLPSPIQDLLSTITNRKMMNQTMADMTYDLEAASLGKLTMTQIKDGYSALNRIAGAISHGSKGKNLIDACDEFYTKIPHNFGRKKPPIIVTQEDLEEKLKMLEALLYINKAVNIFNKVSIISEHPLDKYYKSLDCQLEPLDSFSSEFEVIRKCLLETSGPTHTSYHMDIINIFSCKKSAEEISFAKYDNKFLLWHGSRLTNWVGILKEGLQIAPFEAPSTGSMFGKGLYFADVSTKSANYCFPTKKQNVGLLLLCEVCLGNPLHLFHSVESMPQSLPSGYESVIGKGKFVPSDFQSEVLSNTAKIPIGPIVEYEENSSLIYNEYVVYSTKQVMMKYLIFVKFNFT